MTVKYCLRWCFSQLLEGDLQRSHYKPYFIVNYAGSLQTIKEGCCPLRSRENQIESIHLGPMKHIERERVGGVYQPEETLT